MATLKSKVVNGKELHQLTFGPKEARALEAAMWESTPKYVLSKSGLSEDAYYDLYELTAQAVSNEV